MVDTTNVAEVLPPDTITDPGTPTLALLEFNVIVAPVEGGNPFKVIVPVAEFPPPTDEGAMTSDPMAAGVTVRIAVFVVPDIEAEIVEFVAVATPVVVIVKVAEVAPVAMLTLLGADALLPADTTTATPPDGAARARVIVPVAELPPITTFGERLSAERRGVSMVRLPLAVVPLKVPEIVAVTVLVTVEVETLNVAEVAPEAIVTDAGTDALDVDEVSGIVIPPEAAGPLIVIVPLAPEPPIIVAGDRLTDVTVGAVTPSVVDLDVDPSVAVIVTLVLDETP